MTKPLTAPVQLFPQVSLLTGLLLSLLVGGCGKGQGEWTFELWTPDELRAGPTTLDDGCVMTWSSLDTLVGAAAIDIPDDRLVQVGAPGAWNLLYERANVIGNNEVTAAEGASVGYDLLVTDSVEDGNAHTTDEALLLGKGWSLLMVGDLQCGAESVTLSWGFSIDQHFDCGSIDVVDGESASTRVLVEPQRIFRSSPSGSDEGLYGEAILSADVDGGGTIVQTELDLVTLESIGYPTDDEELLTLGDLTETLATSLSRVEGGQRCSPTDGP